MTATSSPSAYLESAQAHRGLLRPDIVGATHYALQALEGLDPRLAYHCLAHTRDSVLPAVEQLALLEGVGPEELMLVRTAALYHDIGFLEARDGHEQVSAELALRVLPQFGYDERQLCAIYGMILATRLPQSPQNLLEELLADADLASLGMASYWQWSGLLRVEWATFGTAFDDEGWQRGQVAFLSSHRYWTRAAQTLLEPVKQQHLAHLRGELYEREA